MSGLLLAAELLLALLTGFIISALWSILLGAPWVPIPLKTGRRMLALADVRPGELVYDLGSGDGRVLLLAARRFDAQAVGVEIDPLRYLWTRLLIAVLGLRGKVRVVWGNLFHQDLGPADVVTVYLSPSANERLVEKLQRELRPGARVVSHEFTFPGWEAVRQDSQAEVYVYQVGEDPGKV